MVRVSEEELERRAMGKMVRVSEKAGHYQVRTHASGAFRHEPQFVRREG